MSRYLVTITDNGGKVWDEFVITNPNALIDLIGLPSVGVVADGEME
jgi:hypothetical protein